MRDIKTIQNPQLAKQLQIFPPKWNELGDLSLSLSLSFFPKPSVKSGDVMLSLRVARFALALALLLDVLDVLLFVPTNEPSPIGLVGSAGEASSISASPPSSRVFPLS
jgi:hypothetical protein